MSRIELILRKSSDADAYDADLVIFDEQGNPSQVVDSLTPMPANLRQSIEDWQRSFAQLVGTRRGTIRPGSMVYGNCSSRSEEVREQTLAWLTSQASWQRLQAYTQQLVSHHEEVQVNIQTVDEKLRLLPWNEVFSLGHRHVETSISLAREFRQQGCLRVQPKVRILAVLGSPCEIDATGAGDGGQQQKPIDVGFDRRLLEQTRARGATIETLNQPSAEALKAALREPQGWHIFFFAGHSKSQQDNTIGSVVLNQQEAPLGIDDLTHELSCAIANGLQIAIFNSCDGLGLAQQLAHLNLPQSIVMREPVPDDVAKDFLQQFLAAFSNHQSLFESVRRARQHLKDKWDLPDRYPGASWLPTIVRNPAVSVPLWSDFVAESPLSKRQLWPLAAVAITLLVSLPISLFLEFSGGSGLSEPAYIYYAQLYPHIVLYPALFLWAAYYSLYKAWCQIKNRPHLWRSLAFCLAVGSIILSIEATADDMLLLELRSQAEAIVEVQPALAAKISNMPESIINTAPLIDQRQSTITFKKTDLELALKNFAHLQAEKIVFSDSQIAAYHAFMKQGLAYDTWQGEQAFSISRTFYLVSSAAMMMAIMSSIVFWQEVGKQHVFNAGKYVRYVITTQVMLLFWFPIRLYHNRITAGIIFGDPASLRGMDVIVYPILMTVLLTTLYKSRRFNANFLTGIFCLLIVLAFLSVGVAQPHIIGLIFGLESSPVTWIVWPLLILVGLYVTYADALATKANR